MEAEKFENLLKEKQIEFDACQKEVEMHKMEIGHLNNRIVEVSLYLTQKSEMVFSIHNANSDQVDINYIAVSWKL